MHDSMIAFQVSITWHFIY